MVWLYILFSVFLGSLTMAYEVFREEKKWDEWDEGREQEILSCFAGVGIFWPVMLALGIIVGVPYGILRLIVYVKENNKIKVSISLKEKESEDGSNAG